MTELGERIRLVRKSHGMTVRLFADTLGISIGHVSGIETGKSAVSDLLIKAIGQRFSVNERWLRTGAEPMQAGPDSASTLQPGLSRVKFLVRTAQDVDVVGEDISTIVLWLAEWWPSADPDSRAWLRGHLRRTVPEFAEWLKQKESK